jgi:hypothetical protein
MNRHIMDETIPIRDPCPFHNVVTQWEDSICEPATGPSPGTKCPPWLWTSQPPLWTLTFYVHQAPSLWPCYSSLNELWLILMSSFLLRDKGTASKFSPLTITSAPSFFSKIWRNRIYIQKHIQFTKKISFLALTGVWTSGFILARLVLLLLKHSTSP